MKYSHRLFGYLTLAIAGIFGGTMTWYFELMRITGLVSVIGVSIAGIVLGLVWHRDASPTRSAFYACLAGFAGIPVCMAFS